MAHPRPPPRPRVGRGALLALVVLVGLKSGCAKEPPGGTPDESPPPDESPAPPVVTITPAEPTTLDDLVASLSGSEAEVTYTWTVDDLAWGEGETVPAAATTRGQVWSVHAVDAAASVTIVNAPPVPASLTITPAAPQEAVDALTCSPAKGVWATDPDGDELGVEVTWVNAEGDEVTGGGSTQLPGDTLPPGSVTAGETWWCRVRVTDGGDTTTVDSDPVLILPFDITTVDPWIEPDLRVDPLDASAGEPLTLSYHGPLAGTAATLDVVLGFDGWVDVAWDTPGTNVPTEEEDDVWLWRLPLTLEGDTWRATFAPPEGVRAMHMVFDGFDAAGAALYDDRGGWEYHWGFDFPFCGPWLSWNDEAVAPTGVVVSFETDVPSLGVVVVTEAEGGPPLAYVGTEVDTLHHVAVTGLHPDTAYRYAVLDSTGGSAVHAFRTLPEGSSPLSLLAMADMQDGGTSVDEWPRVAELAWEVVPDAAAILAPGDLAANDRPGLWWRYFAGGGALFASVPQVPMVGNHDTPGKGSSSDYSSFTRWFALPAASGSEAYYRVDVGPLRVFALSSEVDEELQPGGTQYEWVAAELGRIPHEAEPPTWVFVGFHHPPYNVGGRFWDEVGTWRPVTALFDGVVDWGFAGHEHLYQRTAPVRFDGLLAPSGAYGNGPEDGSGWLVMPTAGDLMFNDLAGAEEAASGWDVTAFPEPPDGSHYYPDEHGFVHILLDGRTFTLESWAVGLTEAPLEPWVRDSLTYTKP